MGTPTILGDALRPIWELALDMAPGVWAGRRGGVFGSYGWSGEGVPNLTERLKAAEDEGLSRISGAV